VIPSVLHVIYDDPANPWVGGGGAVRLREIYRRLKGRVSVTIVTGRYPGSRDEVIDGVTYLRRGLRRPYALSRLSFGVSASRMLRSESYDAAIFDFSAYSPVRIPANRPVGIMLAQLVGGSSQVRWGRGAGRLVARFERRQLSRARIACAMSNALAEEARPWLRPGAKVSVVGAGVADEYFQVTRQESDYFLYLGRFDVFQKGIDTLLAATASLSHEMPHIRVRMIGRGRGEGTVRELVTSKGLASTVEIIVDPPRELIASSLAGALALLVPSRFEGFGMVAAEGMAAGTPVIASDIPVLREVIAPPSGGILFAEGDSVALAQAMKRLASDTGLRSSLSISARTRARRFSWDAVAEEHSRFVHEVAALSDGNPVRSATA
jgi:glycosyltransferase involved in cell wall biosynthesis